MSSVAYRNFFSMGTRIDIILPGCDDESADSICLRLQHELKRTEEKISIYIPESDFSIINKLAFNKPVKTDEEIFDLLDEVIRLSEKTHGFFDFTLGRLLKLIQEDTSLLSDEKKLGDLIQKTGTRYIKLDRKLHTISVTSDLVSIDSGGFGKGFGLDLVKNIMKDTKIYSYFISFGESSILACGSHPYGNSWKTGIRNIFKEDEYICSFEMRDEFLSVSGITPQNLKKFGTGHIINPVNGKPVARLLHAAVKGKNGLATEALSTALIVAPEEHRDMLMKEFTDCSAVIFEYDENNNAKIIYQKTI